MGWGLALTGLSALAATPAIVDMVGDQKDVDKQLGSDYYDPETKSVKGRDTLERISDKIFSRDIEGAAKRRLVKDREAKEGGLLTDAGYEYSADTTEKQFDKLLREARDKKDYVTQIRALGQSPLSTRELYGMDPGALSAMVQKDAQTKRTSDDATNPETIRQIAATTEATKRYEAEKAESDKRYYGDRAEARELRKDERLDRIDQRMSDREVRMLELGMQERMFDKRMQSDARADKKQRMAAIIAGLANLGGAFAI